MDASVFYVAGPLMDSCGRKCTGVLSPAVFAVGFVMLGFVVVALGSGRSGGGGDGDNDAGVGRRGDDAVFLGGPSVNDVAHVGHNVSHHGGARWVLTVSYEWFSGGSGGSSGSGRSWGGGGRGLNIDPPLTSGGNGGLEVGALPLILLTSTAERGASRVDPIECTALKSPRPDLVLRGQAPAAA